MSGDVRIACIIVPIASLYSTADAAAYPTSRPEFVIPSAAAHRGVVLPICSLGVGLVIRLVNCHEPGWIIARDDGVAVLVPRLDGTTLLALGRTVPAAAVLASQTREEQ
ncbi:hypothetical protein DFH08DRAFT_1083425 [Mycena albidolilacea]|uniref:Uncharacterized protein n=1 Tax=Mycena albidolilacea TaxID=1033008 RepID=A0AAD6ZR43_9AGAR|nr:hypothetical protein DFH08DRAFT_1083425 [Mycena albidolilacea]